MTAPYPQISTSQAFFSVRYLFFFPFHSENGKFTNKSRLACNMYDVFFLSFNEPMADNHWRILRQIVPTARRVDRIEGIHAAHRACAEMSKTSHFFVVDADNEIIDADFSYNVPFHQSDYAHVWHARNPLNGLEYGWGGVKLFPTPLIRAVTSDSLDMTTSLPLIVIPNAKSITHFNTDALTTWRSAFRECVKLSISDDVDARQRLDVWTTTASGYMADMCLLGARAGKAYGQANHGDREALLKINDYAWLAARFESETA